MLKDQFLIKMTDIVGDNFVVTDLERLSTVAVDETPNLKPSLPDAWVRPANEAQVAQVMALAYEHGVPVTPRGAGSGQSGGCVPLHGGIVLGLDRLNQIDQIDTENMIAKAQPGVILESFQKEVEGHGLFYPPDPASLQWCTLGGNVAENAGGPRALKYGVTKDYCLGLRVVLPHGEIIETGKQTVKGVAGYDLTSLMCGSEGTLGVITNITFKLIPNTPAVQTAIVVFGSAQDAAQGVAEVFKNGVIPRTLEYLDRDSIQAVANHGAPYTFPALAAAALIVETDGTSDEEALNHLLRALDAMNKAAPLDTLLAKDERQRRDIWQTRRLLSEATRKIKKRKISEDVVVPRSKIPEMVAEIGRIGEANGLGTCAFGHAGDGNLHVQVLFDEESEMPQVLKSIDEIFAATLKMGGTITGEHGVGIAKQKYLAWEQSPKVLSLQREIKKVFDPKLLLNPGKFIPTL
ncbi:MAG: FAD-linked oxidase [Myxococcales bacterium]|nr:FAD-linked oxidase [Myxococcales bacterium]